MKECVLNTINFTVAAVQAWLNDANEENTSELYKSVDELINILNEDVFASRSKSRGFKYKEEALSVVASWEDISSDNSKEEKNFTKKIEFEFYPLLCNLRMDYYYYKFIFGDKDREKLYFENELYNYFSNPYITKANETGEYKYDLSIVIVAYNKLEYTKLCVESVIKFMPKNLKCELILLNHGSNDGTKEYFENINPDKQINIQFNGGGFCVFDRVVEGHYVVVISNDVIITPKAIENMYNCITSDEDIAWVVPSTPNISNYQDIGLVYSDMEEMFAASERNNVSDRRRWEQRTKICDPIAMYDINKRIECICGKVAIQPNRFFIDDICSLLYRRNGYKLILDKDSYCYHFGSVTINEDNGATIEKFIKGRIGCLKEFGLDPWGYGYVYDSKFLDMIGLIDSESINILGINSGLGANLLKLKSMFIEEKGNYDVRIDSLTQFKMNEKDLRGISDSCIYDRDMDKIGNFDHKYNYILYENIAYDDVRENIKYLSDYLKPKGKLFVRVKKDSFPNGLNELDFNIFESNDSNVAWLQFNKDID